MAILASKNFTAAKILPPMRLDLDQEIITCSRATLATLYLNAKNSIEFNFNFNIAPY